MTGESRAEARRDVENARADLVATLNALEDRLNFPKRIGRATRRAQVRARAFYAENPGGAIAAAAGVAAAVGGIVWLVVRSRLDD
ncbi:DUF3618 domain-containing protein [Agromyces atrinae]|jgi:ElaB/YqjD/DUF883 family membrane-anchored ribosome-binding protein|uniref:DUF3618 domain-containing protein n=1 Tax=Agromyces atrinae TaxID=592376 RepID=UPI001F5AA252|nr:DUF3618 domain-containing protein [Agromyces atrinae]MCI2956954.1 DUF3618 domain-containing protein [Agromyces atrinae]